MNKLFMTGVGFFGATTALFAAEAEEVSGGSIGIGESVLTLIYIAILVIFIIGTWKAFTKAGRPGWAILIPIYNKIVMLQIAGRPIWWILLFFIPIVNLVVAIIVSIDIAKAFGKGTGFGIGIAFLPFIFFPILGYGDSKYTG
jgi:uncharacterized membrane protein YhaH (DUF805 family)